MVYAQEKKVNKVSDIDPIIPDLELDRETASPECRY